MTTTILKHRTELHLILPKEFIASELGVAEGRFTLDLLNMGAGKVYAVDTWANIPGQIGDGGSPAQWHAQNWADFQKRVWPHKLKVHPLRGFTSQMAKYVADGELDLLYIDADHSFDGCLKDLLKWYIKVKPGGVIAGHDVLNPSYGVARAVDAFCKDRGYKPIIIPENSPENASFYFIKK